ncbi:hypothetical protein [Amycolatopsis anabasis]|uniref:hypothetical protein n=1 Tax=Amycolatopsis anabasis TaxID=1840409 RepID=UPI00131D7C69|nr:hypothetical protein [Amycolatopsis anabasis]
MERSSKTTRLLLGLPAAALVLALGAVPATADPGNGHGGEHGAPAKPTKKSGPDTGSPQPPSTADFSGHGANTHGPYDSTRDGSPSANGNGGGKAAGKPCAGCVGKADNKSPSGQLPGGSDPDAGYECDRNHGVGRGNPAHTACEPGTATPPPVENPPGATEPGQVPPGQPPTAPHPMAPPPAIQPAALAATTIPALGPPATESLAHTGFDAELPTLAALALLSAGTVLYTASRRRAAR